MIRRKDLFRIAAGVLFLIGGSSSALAGPPENVIRNPEFSAYTGGFATDWIPSQPDAIQIREEKGVRFLRWPANSQDEPVWIRQTIEDLPIPEGREYKLHCKYRVASPDSGLKVELRNNKHQPLFTQIFRSEKSQTWLEQTIDLALPASTKTLEVRVSPKGSGSMDLAGVSFEVSDASADELVLFSLWRPDISPEGGPEQVGWDGLQVAMGMLKMGTPDPAPAATTCRSAYDDTKVSFLLEMDGKFPDDKVEIWLGPRGQNYPFFQFIIGNDGTTKSYLRTDGPARPVAVDFECKVFPGGGGWAATLHVPFAELQSERPPDNVRWGFNISRYSPGKTPGSGLSSWAPVTAFDEVNGFGELAFYSQAEVEADMAYWENNDNDPLLRRLAVSGVENYASSRKTPPASSFWTYNPFSVDRAAAEGWKCRGLTDSATARRRGLSISAEADHPEFFHSADELNQAILKLAEAQLAISQTERSAYYTSQWGIPIPKETQKLLTQLTTERARIDLRLDQAYAAYHAAFHADWNPAGLGDMMISALSHDIQNLNEQAKSALAQIQARVQAEHPWIAQPTTWNASKPTRNENGAPTRLWFTSYGLYGDEPAARYFAPFRSWNIDWPYLVAQRDLEGAFTLPYAQTALNRLVTPDQKINFQTGFGLVSYQAPSSPWLEERITTTPSILAQSQDHLPIPKVQIGSLDAFMRRGVNISHPTTVEYAQDYLNNLVRTLAAKRSLDFIVTGWEDRTELRLYLDGKLFTRQRGYDPVSQKAFQDFLKERYGSIAALKEKWQVPGYDDFSDIQPAIDRFLVKSPRASGLSYEWNRWQRSSHFDWTHRLRQAIRGAAENTPVMTDSSHLLLDGAAWESISHQSSDILSFHSNPSNEDAMFAYLESLTREKNLPLACFENYAMMYSRLEGQDERLAARSMRRYFHDLLARNVHMLTFWLRYTNRPTSYIAAYGGGYFRLDEDQTVLRWPSAEIRLFKQLATALERPLVESVPAQGEIAVLIPDSSILQTQFLMGEKPYTPLDPFITLQNRIFSPANLPVEYLHEDQLTDSRDLLSPFRTLVVMDAAFLQPEVLAKLRDWTVQPDKNLFVIGAMGFFDQYGQSLPPEASPLRAAFPHLRTREGQVWQLANPDEDVDEDFNLETRPFGEGRLTRLTQNFDVFRAKPGSVHALQEALTESISNRLSVNDENIRVQLRRGPGKERYVLVSNRDVENVRDFSVTVKGFYTGVYDLGIPGWFPVAFEKIGGNTIFSARLDPGDWTLFALASEDLPKQE